MLLAVARRLSGGQAGGSAATAVAQPASPLVRRARSGWAGGSLRRAALGQPGLASTWPGTGWVPPAAYPASTAPHALAASAAAAAGAAVPSALGPAAAAGITDPATFVVVNFYHLVDVAEPGKLHAAHARALATLDIAGRIYITPQGINAQFSGPAGDADAYVAWVRSETPGFGQIRPSAEAAPGGGHLFPRLRLKLKADLISLAGGCGRLPLTDPAARAKPLTPDEWAAMLGIKGGAGSPPSLSLSSTPPILLDVRNGYEWDAGHFQGAARPLEDNFNETPTDISPRPAPGGDSEGDHDEASPPPPPLPIPAHLDAAPRDAPVLMYCTGGIRCDVYSAHLTAQGFTNLYTLEGGVHGYFRERGGAGWDGSLFVFDARLAVSPDGRSGLAEDGGEGSSAPPLAAAMPCAVCGAADAALPHLNCANIDCNRLFLACRACVGTHAGCCCAACTSAPRLLRPAKVSGQYGLWGAEVSGGTADRASPPPADVAAAMAAGRGDGRLVRRRARAARLAAARDGDRAERARRKAAVRKALAERGEGGGGEDEEDTRTGRMEALKARLKARLGRSDSSLVAVFDGGTCPSCGSATASTRISSFSSKSDTAPLLVAADSCSACGWKGGVDAWESDGGAASTATTPFRLVIASAEDAAAPLPPLHPDAALSIPELDLQLAPGSRAVAGATTPAALLAAFRADLGGRRAVAVGESDDNAEWSSFWERFEEAETGRAPWTLVVGGGDDDF